MSKYCRTSSVEGAFCSDSPLLAGQKSKLTTCSIDDVCAPGKTVTCDPCAPTKSTGCIPGCTSYSRYSVCDWEHAYNANYSAAERERNTSERLRSDAWCTVQTADKETHDKQCTSTKKLGERVYEIAFWKEQLLCEIRAMETESDNLAEHARVLERTLCETKLPLSIIEECLLQREKRLGIECVHDEVERGLCKEIELIRNLQERLREFIQRAYCQLKKNRAIQHNLDLDVRDKHHAQGIDDRNHQLRNSSCKIGFFPGIENVDETITNAETWIRFTQGNIASSQAEREASERLRSEIDCFLRSATKEMWHQFNQVNSAFNARIQEITDAKNRLQLQLERTNNEIRDMDRIIQLIRRSIHDKELTLKVAQTRLEERTKRRCIELSHDAPMVAMQKEVHDLYETVCRLKEKLRQAENAMCRLLKTRAMLEQDIAIKETTLQIDSAFCMGLRKKMPMDPKIGPVLIMPHVAC